VDALTEINVWFTKWGGISTILALVITVGVVVTQFILWFVRRRKEKAILVYLAYLRALCNIGKDPRKLTCGEFENRLKEENTPKSQIRLFRRGCLEVNKSPTWQLLLNAAIKER
jgi:hypothetical protein